MNDEQPDRSLAAQAAAWVPPWARQAPPSPPADPVDEPEGPVDAAVELVNEPADAVDEPVELVNQPAEPVDEPAEPVDVAVESPGAAVESVDQEAEAPAAPAAPAADQPECQPDEQPDEPVGPDGAAEEPQPTGEANEPEPAEATVSPVEVERPAALLDAAELRGALEAILLVVDEPVSDALLADVTEQPVERITAALEELAAEYSEAGRGFALRRAAGGWRLYTREAFAPYVERFVLDGQQSRLTQASLETLAVVAYKQPVTRSQVSAIRGVNCDGVMRTLVTRGLIEESGMEPETGARLFRTTTLFLEKLGLNSVDELPPLAPFLPDDVNEIADAQH